MPDTVQRPNAKAVIIIAPFELAEHIAKECRKLGASGLTSAGVDGDGAHGPRTSGPVDGANVRLEIITSAKLAERLLEHVVAEFDTQGVMAYSFDVDAVPRGHFA